MKRWSILILALLLGAAAPVRAWCEAACLAPAHAAASHCPSHESSSDAPAMAATSTADCPVIDTARPTQAKLEFALAPVALAVRQSATRHPSAITPGPTRIRALRHLSNLPLRI